MHRHELKYYINRRDVYMLKQYLKHFMQLDQNANQNGEYWIRSLYFDTIGNRDYYQKINGDTERKKLRIRIYDTSDVCAKLEIKNKTGAMTDKESVIISKEAALLLINNDYRFLLNINNKTALKFYKHFQSGILRPVVIVDYVRQAFFLPYDSIRVTIDKDLKASMDFDHMFYNDVPLVNVQRDAICILEIKYGNVLPGFIKSILTDISPQSNSISKYVMSRQALHF